MNWEKRRVSIVLSRPKTVVPLQMVSWTMMMQKQKPAQEGAPPYFTGPTHALWSNVQHIHPEIFKGFELVGVLCATPPNINEMEWAGHIDWVQPTDEPEHKLSEENIIDAEYEVVKH
jgi:hypothetical protein